MADSFQIDVCVEPSSYVLIAVTWTCPRCKHQNHSYTPSLYSGGDGFACCGPRCGGCSMVYVTLTASVTFEGLLDVPLLEVK